MLSNNRARPGLPTLAALALVSGLAAVVGVAAIDASPADDEVVRELVSSALAVAPQAVAQPDDPLVLAEVARAGDTIWSLLSRAGVVDGEAARLLRSHAELAPVRRLAAGSRVTIERDEAATLARLEYVGPDMRRISLARDGEELRVARDKVSPEAKIALRAGSIGKSLFSSLRSLGVPDAVQRQLVTIFSRQFDMLKSGAELERVAVAYEEFVVDGVALRPGRVLAAEVVRDGRTYRAVWFGGGRNGRYFTPEGGSLDRVFLPSPLEFTQVTSWFGEFRNLPWNTGTPHRGIDYAAPVGTPVKAAGDGVVDFAGVQRGYGNVVILKHREPYSTLYAHLDEFAAEVAEGRRVKQGEVIGFVGQTGWATGPHLHYEFRKNGEAQDPSAEEILPADQLVSTEAMERFRTESSSLSHLLDRLADARRTAEQ